MRICGLSLAYLPSILFIAITGLNSHDVPQLLDTRIRIDLVCLDSNGGNVLLQLLVVLDLGLSFEERKFIGAELVLFREINGFGRSLNHDTS